MSWFVRYLREDRAELQEVWFSNEDQARHLWSMINREDFFLHKGQHLVSCYQHSLGHRDGGDLKTLIVVETGEAFGWELP